MTRYYYVVHGVTRHGKTYMLFNALSEFVWDAAQLRLARKDIRDFGYCLVFDHRRVDPQTLWEHTPSYYDPPRSERRRWRLIRDTQNVRRF